MNPNYAVPIQIVREQTLRGKGTQNFGDTYMESRSITGLYYKTGEIPWILERPQIPTNVFHGCELAFTRRPRLGDLVLSSDVTSILPTTLTA